MASRSVNKVLLIGNLGRDAETKFTPSGASVTQFFTWPPTRRWKDQGSGRMERGDQLDQRGALAAGKCRKLSDKGKQVYVEGRLQTRSYDDKDGKKVYTTEVVADDVLLLGGRGESGGGPETVIQPAAVRYRRTQCGAGEQGRRCRRPEDDCPPSIKDHRRRRAILIPVRFSSACHNLF